MIDKVEAAERLAVMIEGAPEYREEQTEAPILIDNRFHFLPASEMCENPKPTLWVVKLYFDSGSFLMIFGPPGSMKSFLAIDMGLCIASGADWHGHLIRHQGPVFYIAGEGFAGLNRRVKAWADHHGVDLLEVPFFVSNRPAQFLEDESVSEIVSAVDELREAHGEPVLIIIDTLARNFGPGDENKTQDMTKFIKAIDEKLRSRYLCAVAVIHHTGLGEDNRGRGSSALRAALDWEYSLKKAIDGKIVLTCTKSKDHEEPPTLVFKPEKVIIAGWNDPEDGTEATSCVLHRVRSAAESLVAKLNTDKTGDRKSVFDTLSAIGGRVSIDDWRQAVYDSNKLKQKAQESRSKAFKRSVEYLEREGLVETEDNYWWVAGVVLGGVPDKITSDEPQGVADTEEKTQSETDTED